jgi:predicted DNA-binding transcriptional regulator AlpA
MSDATSAISSANDKALSTPAAAARVLCSPATLNKYRLTGAGPRFFRIGRKIFYWQSDLDKWISSRPRHESTAEYVA